MKTTSLLSAAALIAFASVVTAATLAVQDSEARRRAYTKPAYEKDQEVISAFDTSTRWFVIGARTAGASDQPLSPELFSNLQTDNQTLQSHTYATDINDEYTATVEKIRTSAQDITEDAEAINTASPEARSELVNAMTEETAVYDGHAETLDTLIAQHEEALEEVNQTSWTVIASVIGGIVGLIVVVFAAVYVFGARKVALRKKELFAHTSAAHGIQEKDQKMLAKVYDGMLLYEKEMKKKSAGASPEAHNNILNTYAASTYEPYKEKANAASFGPYRSLIFEYAGLIELNKGNAAEATRMFQHATQLAGKLYSATATEYMSSVQP